MPDVPASVLGLIELPPADQIFLKILREAMPDILILPRIPYNALSSDGVLNLPSDPFIMSRKSSNLDSNITADPRFIGETLMEVQVFTTDPDGETKGLLISEACRVALRNAWLQHREYPGLGAVSRIDQLGAPNRKSDWATALGPVQYADLPANAWRHETRYRLVHRKPHRKAP